VRFSDNCDHHHHHHHHHRLVGVVCARLCSLVDDVKHASVPASTSLAALLNIPSASKIPTASREASFVQACRPTVCVITQRELVAKSDRRLLYVRFADSCAVEIQPKQFLVLVSSKLLSRFSA